MVVIMASGNYSKLVLMAKEKQIHDVFWIVLAWLVAIALVVVVLFKTKLFTH